MPPDVRPHPSRPLLPASVRLHLPADVADAAELLLRTLHDQSLDAGAPAMDGSLPVAETRAAADDLDACAARLRRIAGYGEHMSLGTDEVPAIAAAGRAARELSRLVEHLRAALEGDAA